MTNNALPIMDKMRLVQRAIMQGCDPIPSINGMTEFRISYPTIMAATDLSYHQVGKAIRHLIKHGYMQRRKTYTKFGACDTNGYFILKVLE